MMLIGTNPLLSPGDPTVRWIAAAVDDPALRLARAVPEALNFQPWADLLRSLQSSTLPNTQLGGSLLLGPDGLEIASELAWRSRYPTILDGKRFIGTVHVHPKGSADTFDAADLTAFLRSDYPGFVDLLVAEEGATAVVRTRRFLYISAARADRDPLLLESLHPGFCAASPIQAEAQVSWRAQAQAAVLTVCGLYELALFRGTLDAALRLEYRPR